MSLGVRQLQLDAVGIGEEDANVLFYYYFVRTTKNKEGIKA